jgi:hypothetical protein
LLRPLVERQREIEGIPEMYEAHRLVDDMLEFEAKRAIARLALDAAKLTELLDYAIEHQTARLRLGLEWKSGVIPKAPRFGAGRTAKPHARTSPAP